MIFPEIAARIKEMLPGFGGMVTLDLKSGVSFGTEDIGWYARNGYPQMYTLLGGGGPSWSGETVSRQSILQHSVVFACKRIISESIGFLPADVMQARQGEKQKAESHPMFQAFKHAPNAEMSAQVFREMLTGHTVLQGNGYAQIIRRSGTGVAVELQSLDPDGVKPDREKTGQKRLVYVVSESGRPDKTYTVERGKPQDILHIRGLGWDGLRGYSVITLGRQSMGTAIAQERNIGRFWANGGRVPYNLKLNQKFSKKDEKEKFRTDWEATYGDPHRAPILEEWVDYQQTGLSMADAQALESRQFSIPEICRWFSVSPHLVGDLSRATFSNIEHLALEFVKMTLNAWITRWEQEFWRSVLTDEEKSQGYYLKHNVNALLRGDFKTRMEGYASALQNGHMNVDEVRDLEDRNPLPEGAGQEYHIQLNMQTLPADGKAESGGLIRLGKRQDDAA